MPHGRECAPCVELEPRAHEGDGVPPRLKGALMPVQLRNTVHLHMHSRCSVVVPLRAARGAVSANATHAALGNPALLGFANQLRRCASRGALCRQGCVQACVWPGMVWRVSK